jgi:hypothetical protein
MKIIALGVVLFSSVLLIAGTPKPDEYDTDVHVTASKSLLRCGDVSNGHSFCFTFQVLTVVVGGHKYELEGTKRMKGRIVLKPGDYKAKVTEHALSGSDLDSTYELLLPDKTTRKFELVAILE